MNLSYILRDCGKLFSGTFVAMLLHLLISPLLTRLYSPADFGVFGYLAAIVMTVAVFTNLRLDMVLPALKSFSHALLLAQFMVLVGAAAGLVALVLLVLTGPLWKNSFPQVTTMGAAIYLLPLAMFVYASFTSMRSLAVRKARFGEIGRAQIWRAVALALLWLGLGYSQVVTAPGMGLIVGQIVADILFALLLLRAQSSRARSFLATFDVGRLSRAISAQRRIIASVASSQLVAGLHSRMTILTIGAVFGPVEAGYYTLAERITGAPEVLSTIIGDVYRQRAARSYFAGENFSRLMLSILGLTLLLSVVPYGIAIYLTPSLIGPILGADWQPAAFTVMLVLVTSLVSFNCATVDKSPVIVGAHRYLVLFQVLRLVAEVVPSAFAVAGWLRYEPYLAFVVAGRSVVMLGDTVVGYVLSSRVRR